MIKKFRFTYILFVLILFTPETVFSNIDQKITEKWRWVKFEKKDGLPNKKIVNILEDDDKRIWISTYNDFLWYDGYYWNKVSNNNIPFTYLDIIRAIQDHKNGLITTSNSKFIKININGITSTSLKYKDKELDLHEVVTVNNSDYLLLVKNSQSNNDYKLYFYNSKGVYPIDFNFTYLQTNEFPFFIKISNDEVWINTSKGIFSYQNGKITLVRKNEYDVHLNINKCLSKNGKAPKYIFSNSPSDFRGIWRIDKPKIERVFSNPSLIKSCAFNTQNRGILTSYDHKVFYFKNSYLKELANVPEPLTNALLTYFSTDGRLWVATDNQFYLCDLKSDKWNYSLFGKSAKENIINDMLYRKDNSLWLATGNGLIIIKKDSNYSLLKDINGKKIEGLTSICEDHQKNVWISSGGHFKGAFRYDGKKWKHFTEKDGFVDTQIHKIKKEQDGKLWFLTLSSENQLSGRGAIYYDYKEFNSISSKNGLPSDRVYDIEITDLNQYWFATLFGLASFKDGNWKYYNKSKGLRTNRVFDIHASKDGNVWITDKLNGVAKVKNDTVEYINILDSANIFSVASIFDDNNSLWLTTNSGFYCYKYNNQTLFSYNKENGLNMLESWPLLKKDEKIFIGTRGGGLNILNLNEYGNKIRLKSELFRPDAKHIQVNIHILSNYGEYKHENIYLRYKLDNNNWSEWTEDTVFEFYNLPHGIHNIIVEAKGINGSLEAEDNIVSFELPPPAYLTPLFYIPFVTLALFSLIFAVYHFIKQKKQSDKINKLNEDLEKRVKDRTAQLKITLDVLKEENNARKLTEEQLIKAKDDLEVSLEKEKELSEMKTRFISLINHEYRTPLTVIMSSTELIKLIANQNNVTDIDKHLDNISNSVTLMTNMLEETLIFSTAKIKNIQKTFSEFDLIQTCQASISHTNKIDKNFNEVILDSTIDNLTLKSNQNYIRQILINILHNATKFSPPKSKIYLNIDKNHEFVSIKVKDPGLGIPVEDIKYIYEPFYRSKKHVGIVQGTGLGLAIVKRYADALGIEIEIESNEGEGTTFTLYIPLIFKQSRENDE